MGKFSRIKKYSKPSQKINEKIDKLNQDLKKTGVLSEITNSTSGVYSVIKYTDPVSEVPPTLTNVPDTSGILGVSFTQPTYGGDVNNSNTWNTGWSSNDYLKNPNNLAGQTNIPIVASVPNSPYGSGGAGIVLYGGYNGTSVGYLTAGNTYKQILVGSLVGGTEDPTTPGARYPLLGGAYGNLTDEQYAYACAFWNTYQALISKYGAYNLPGKDVNGWIGYSPFWQGGTFQTYSGGPKRIFNNSEQILTGFYVIGHSNTYTSNPGSPYKPGYTTVLFKTNLGDPNYYPGPIPPAIARGEGKPAPFTEDNYNWYNKMYGLPAAEWYRNNPTTPPSSNPFLPKGAYVPLALGPEIMNKLGASTQAAQSLIAQVVPSGPHTEVYYDKQMKMFVPKGAPQGFPGNLPAQGASIPLGV